MTEPKMLLSDVLKPDVLWIVPIPDSAFFHLQGVVRIVDPDMPAWFATRGRTLEDEPMTYGPEIVRYVTLDHPFDAFAAAEIKQRWNARLFDEADFAPTILTSTTDGALPSFWALPKGL